MYDDPASDDGVTFGVPLLPAEVARVTTAQAAANATSDLVAAYGATVPDDWAGMFVDQQTGGTVVARFSANVAEHRAALLALLPAGAKVEVRSATWTNAELQGFIARVEQERAWFPTIGTELFTVEIAGLDNLGAIDVRFDGPKAAAGAIEAHFGNPPWLRAVWNGPGEWTGPRGDLEIGRRMRPAIPYHYWKSIWTPRTNGWTQVGELGTGPTSAAISCSRTIRRSCTWFGRSSGSARSGYPLPKAGSALSAMAEPHFD